MSDTGKREDMHGKRDVVALLAPGTGGLLASSMTTTGAALGAPPVVVSATALAASTAERVRRIGRETPATAKY
jgi:hypothetical protein